MRYVETALAGAYVIELEAHGDDRGFFARVFCDEEFTRHGLEPRVAQVNDSLSRDRGTLRGLHYQLAPAAETKLVRCIAGSLYDVILDLRPESATFGRWYGAELTARNRCMMYVPRGFAHAFLTLESDTEALYLSSHPYAPEQERGVRFDDPHFRIEWPIAPVVVSEKDRSHPDFDPTWHLSGP